MAQDQLTQSWAEDVALLYKARFLLVTALDKKNNFPLEKWKKDVNTVIQKIDAKNRMGIVQ